MAKLSGIYCIENIINGMRYIGKTVDLINRFCGHRSELNKNKHPNSYLQNAWNKYGEENFRFYVLEYAEREKLADLEKLYISLYKTNNRKYGYNLTDGGEGTLGLIFTEEHRRKLSEKRKGRKASEETKNKMKGRKKTDEERRKLSLANKGKKISPELSPIFRDYKLGKKRTDIVPSSKFLGVSKPKKDNQWLAHIYIDYKQTYLGIFDSEVDAALKYNEEIVKYYGDKATLNIITEEDIKNGEIEKQKMIDYRLSLKSSKYKGVHWCNSTEKWIARYYFEGKTRAIGKFKYEVEAALAYNEAVLEVFGYNAKINNISQKEIDLLWELE